MKSLILRQVEELRLEDVPTPRPADGELLIRVKAATTCGTDLKAFRRGHPQIPMPGPLGHEYAGVVEAAGEGARFSAGDAVMGVHSAPCGKCRWCAAGQGNLCETIMETKVLGAYSEFLLIPKRIADVNVFSKPQGLSFELASLLEPLACVAQGILELRKVGALPAESALVVGPGAIGLMFVAALKASGVSKVVLAGRNVDRLKVGEGLGAEIAPWPTVSTEHGFDVVIEGTGQVEVWEKVVDFSRRGGVAMLFGGPPAGSRASFSTNRLHYDQVTLLSPFHFGLEAVRLAYGWLAEGAFDLRPLLSGVRMLEEAEATFQDLIAGRGIKYVFVP